MTGEVAAVVRLHNSSYVHCTLCTDTSRLRNRAKTSSTTSLSAATNGLITIAIRARFEYDSTTIRLQHATTRYEVFRSLAYEIVYENQW